MFLPVALSLALVLTAAPASAAPAARAGAAASPPLKVGVAGSSPFVVRDGAGGEGLSVDIWRAVARKASLPFQLVPVPSVAEALDQVEQGVLDVAVGPISITSARLERVDFTHRYHQSALSILAAERTTSIADVLKPFARPTFLWAVAGLLTILFVVGLLLWLSERRANPQQFPGSPVRGVGNGVWMALVTMTTVGYGDRVPVTVPGRIVTGVWMLIAMITASSLTAGIASALTLQHLQRAAIASAEDLEGRKVAVVPGTTSEDFALRNAARAVVARDLEAAVALLRDGKVDAVVYDRPMLQYWLSRHPDVDLILSEGRWEPQGYGFAVPIGSGLAHRLDVSLQAVREAGELNALQRKWLGGE